MLTLQGHEEPVIFQPPQLLGDERIEGSAGVHCLEALKRLIQHAHFPGDDRAEVHAFARKDRYGEIIWHEVTAPHQILQIDQQGIAGEGGEALVRRVAIPGGAKRQYLPELLFGFVQPIDKMVGVFAKITDAERAREGGGVKEDAGSSL